MPSRFVVLLLLAAAGIQIARAQVVETSDKEDTTGLPRVVFFRPAKRQGSGLRAAVYCDLTKVAEIRNNTYFEVALSPGLHVCSTELLNIDRANRLWLRPSIVNPEEFSKPYELALEVKPGPKQWVSVRCKDAGGMRVTFTLAPEDSAQATKEVEKKHIQSVKPEEQAIRSISRTPAGPTGN